MAETIMTLGRYRFSMATAAYQELRHSVEYRWPKQDRLTRKPARQFTGPRDETIGLSGVIYPHHQGGLTQLDAMRTEAGQGKPLMLTDGLGHVWGQWVILRVEDTGTVFWSNGAPRKIDFRLELARYGEDA